MTNVKSNIAIHGDNSKGYSYDSMPCFAAIHAGIPSYLSHELEIQYIDKYTLYKCTYYDDNKDCTQNMIKSSPKFYKSGYKFIFMNLACDSYAFDIHSNNDILKKFEIVNKSNRHQFFRYYAQNQSIPQLMNKEYIVNESDNYPIGNTTGVYLIKKWKTCANGVLKIKL